MLDKLRELLLPPAIRERLDTQQAQIEALCAWRDQVEAVWPQIVEVDDGTN